MNTTLDDPARWRQVEQAFAHALDQPIERRAAWLQEHVPDALVRAEVAEMLDAHDRVTGVLDRPPVLPHDDPRPRVEAALRSRYTILDLLGRGGSATVYLAREHKHDREVVVKVLHPEVAAHVGVHRFMMEVRIAAKLSHPHILPLIDSGEADGLLYYVMPRLDGETLRERLRARGRLPAREAVELLRDIAGALDAAHAHGIVHRDLKPENVLCVGTHAYLLDFGIARHTTGGDTGHTQEGLVVGTMGYLSPEQAAGRPVDGRSDLFALGVVAREMVTGVRPLVETRDLGRIPARLAELIEDLLHDDPADRPATARAVVERLDALPLERPARRRVLIAAAAVVAVLALALTIPWRAESSNGLPGPIAVAPLRNETGDSTLAIWGRMAADWLTQGLHETSLVNVVPWPSVRQASEALGDAGAVTPARLAGEVHAAAIVSGAYYAAGDQVVFRLDVTDARRDRLIGSLPPIQVGRDSLHLAIREARERLMGFVALAHDERAASLPGIERRPPTFDAYRAFDRGLALYNRQQYAQAATEFRQAWTGDTTFVAPLIYAAMAHWNREELAWVDTLVTMALARRERLSEYDQLQVEYLSALLASDGARAVAAGRRAVAIAPESRAAYNLGRDLIAMNRAAEGLAVLRAIRPDVGLMKGWPSYWTQLTHALHLTGAHEEELQAARSMRARFPELRVAWVLEARALATLGRLESLDSLLAITATLPAATYWSHGGALVVAGEELFAHRDSLAGRRYLERAADWLRRADGADPSRRDHPYWLGSAYYDLGLWRQAASAFSRLYRNHPDRFQHRGLAALGLARVGDRSGALTLLGDPPRFARSEHTMFRARIAAATGDSAASVALQQQALAEVADGFAWLHASAFRDLRPR